MRTDIYYDEARQDYYCERCVPDVAAELSDSELVDAAQANGLISCASCGDPLFDRSGYRE